MLRVRATSNGLRSQCVGRTRAGASRSVAMGVVLTVVTLACGAKTGLRVPDIGPDAMDAWIPPEVCAPGRFPLEPRGATVMFLFDRSTSMNLGLDGFDTRPTRWEALRAGLTIALPIYQAQLEMGAVFFPRVPRNTDIGALCEVLSNVDLPVATNRANDILRVLTSTAPLGGTPTYEAIRVATRYLSGIASRARGRYMVLATDGGPNCNPALDARSCVCTSQNSAGAPTCAASMNGRYNCLDDRRTLDAIREAQRQGIPMFVIGIDDATRPDLNAVLDQMAIEGGRANTSPGGRRYYSVRRAADLTSAFQRIQDTIVRCAFVTPSRPDDPSAIRVEVNGESVTRDTERREGWDWTDPAYGEITFFGPVCERVLTTTARVEAVVGCNDGG